MSAAQRSKDENKIISSFSKVWNRGETWLVFYPLAVFDDNVDVVVNATYGNKINDVKGLGLHRIFIPYAGKTENGRPVEGCLANDFAKIARAILKGEESKAIKELDNNRLLAADPDLKAKKEKAIKEEMEQKRPVIGGFTKVITTECVAVKLNSEGVPDVKTAQLASQELSGKKVATLKQIMMSPLYQITKDMAYLPVIYTFGVQEKKAQAGNVDPTGVSPEQRVDVKYPDIWRQLLPTLESMAHDSDMIGRRNSIFTPLDNEVLLAALKSYIVDFAEDLDFITDDQTKKVLETNVDTLLTLGIRDLKCIDIDKIKADREKINKAIEAQVQEDVKEAEAAAEDVETNNSAFELDDADLNALMNTALGE
jgi:hypothetical protein